MKEQLVSFELAKMLKEVGFDWRSESRYGTGTGILYNDPTINDLCEDGDHTFTAAPTLSLAQKWFREEKGIIVFIQHSPNGYGFEWFINDDEGNFHEASESLETWEDNLEAGLLKACELLKEKKS